MLKPKNLGARIEAPFTPDEFVLFCQKLGGVTDEEAYQTWNMGQGMIVATPDPDRVIAVADTFGIKAKESVP
jgi:phosphoribosylaminoimidazole (AIR) synthetase